MTGVRPGDVLVFHGIVGGARGPCLVIGVHEVLFDEGRQHRNLTMLAGGPRIIDSWGVFLDEEDEAWSRISER